MCYIYQAALFCDDCGAKLRATLPIPEACDPRDEHTYDSDDYPKGPFNEDESDGPDHCASGADCVNAIDLAEYGLTEHAKMYGAETCKIGALVCDGLTDYGRDYTRELCDEPARTSYQMALHALWREMFNLELMEDPDYNV